MRSVMAVMVLLSGCAPELDVSRPPQPPDVSPPVIGPVLVQSAAGCARIRAPVDEQVTVTLLVWPEGQDARELPGGSSGPSEVDVALPFRGLPQGVAALVVRVVDDAGNVAEAMPVAVDVTAPPPPVVISEVLANPAGTEGVQEWVELANVGAATVELAGYAFRDSTGTDVLPPFALPAGGRVLLVPTGFLAGAGEDTPPLAGASLLRVDTRLGSNGLSNAGEAVQLIDGSGLVVSSYGGWVDTSGDSWSGKTVQRNPLVACDHASSWNVEPANPTPGW